MAMLVSGRVYPNASKSKRNVFFSPGRCFRKSPNSPNPKTCDFFSKHQIANCWKNGNSQLFHPINTLFFGVGIFSWLRNKYCFSRSCDRPEKIHVWIDKSNDWWPNMLLQLQPALAPLSCPPRGFLNDVDEFLEMRNLLGRKILKKRQIHLHQRLDVTFVPFQTSRSHGFGKALGEAVGRRELT